MTAPTPPPFNPNVPLSTQNIAETQPNFLNNFRDLFTAFSKNHVDLNAVSGAGNHNIVELTEQTEKLTTTSQEIAWYTKKVEGQTDQIFMRYPSNGKEFQISEYQIYPLDPIIINNIVVQIPYFSVLPGGIIVYFGKIIPSSDNFNLILNPTICRNIMGVNLCPIGPASFLYQSNVGLILHEGRAAVLVLKNSTTFSTPPNQYYMVFGNI